MVRMGYYQQGNVFLVHIRDYKRRYSSEEPHFPEKEGKGIALSMDLWNALVENMKEIHEDAVSLS